MNQTRPILHLSLHVDCNSLQKRMLRKLLSSYTQRQDQWSPALDISIDSYDAHIELQFQQEMLYYATKTNSIQQPLANIKQIYMAAVILIDFTLKLLYEDNRNSRAEEWLLLSFTHSGEN